MTVVGQIMTLCKFIFCPYELVSSVVSLLGLHARAAILDTKSTARCWIIFMQQNSTYLGAGYPDQLGLSCKFVETTKKLSCLEISSYWIKHSTVLWLLELQIRCGQKVQTQVHTVNSNSQTSDCQCSLFSKKNPIIRIFYISRLLAVPINMHMWSSVF